jgi:hypothetical protein
LLSGSSSYQNSLAVDAAIEGEYQGGAWSAKFSASVGYKEVKQGSSSYRKIYVETVARCVLYLASLKSGIQVSFFRMGSVIE